MAGYSVTKESETTDLPYDTSITEVTFEPDSLSNNDSCSTYATYNGDFKERFRLVSILN